MAVTGRPQLALTVGTRTRWATCAASGPGLKCLYAVQVADRDADGISVPADALRLDGATIKARPDGFANAALEHLLVVDQSSARVDGGRATSLATSLHLLYPWDVTAYERGETIWVGLRVGRDVRLGRGGRGVVVTGNPRVALRVGDRERLATYSAKGPQRRLPASLQSDAANVVWFGYVVRAEDLDTNGVSIGANAVRLNGGAVRLAVDGLTEPPLTHAAVGSSFLRKVDGGRFGRPLVGRIAVTGLPRNGDTYGLGEAIRLSVRFTRPVAVSGTPQVLLTIGDQTGVASYSEGVSSTRTHIFEYAVQPNDRDAGGISIPANALRLNGGRITLADGVTDADLTHAAVGDDIVRKVDAGVVTVPAISGVSLRGSPVSGDTYAAGETIEVAVLFTGAVVVTGHPQVELTIGERTRYAAHIPDLRNRRTLYFQYTVQPTDLDSDGIGIPANALRLNGATIRLADGATDALLTHPAIADDPRRKVRGGDNAGDACRRQPPTSDPDLPSSGPPVAAFALEASCAGEAFAVRAGVEVVLRDVSRGTVKTRNWNFGDGATSSVQHPRHVWVVPGFYRVSLTVSDGETSSTAFHDVLVEASAPAGSCRPDAVTRCLQGSRYEVRVLWTMSGGGSGRARVAHAGTDESGLFWFFDRENWEILVKVLDGCSTNGHFWVFGAATTDLGFRFTVTDTATGRVRVYRHEPGEPAAAITDSTAFADGCRR